MADENNIIPHTIEEIAAKLEEPLGRPISGMTVREYMRNAGFSWLTTNRGTSKVDRVAELAKIVHQIMTQYVGITDPELEMRLERITRKQGTNVEAP
jgi:hypothetical protein